MKRTAVFAAFDKDSKVHPYVLTYLKKLKEVCDNIIYIADNEPDYKELSKLTPYVCHIECQPHGEYDFGSYKRGYIFAKENSLLDDSDELILCNDSCFCVGDFKTVLFEMDKKDLDFYSMTGSIEIQKHLQSYFLVLKKNVFTSKVFEDYLLNVKKLSGFLEIVRTYEVPLLKTFAQAGFKGESYLDPVGKWNPTFYPVLGLKKHNPLIKRKIFTDDWACRESLFKLASALKKADKQAYEEILEYFNIKSIFPIWFKFFYPKFIGAFYRTQHTDRGFTRVRILSIPLLKIKDKN